MSGVNPKVAAATAAAAVTTILVWVAGELGVDVPASVSDALVVLFVFAAGYFKSDAAQSDG